MVVDNTQPSVTLGGVTAGSSVRGSLNLTGLSANGTGSLVQSVLFGRRLGSSGGFTDIGVADTSSPYGVSFDTSTVADGTYDFQALITDAAGNTNTTIVSGVVVDNTQPSVTLGGVTAGSSVRGSLNLTGLSANGTGSLVQSVLFGRRLGSSGGFTDIGVADTSSPYGVTFNTTARDRRYL